jgi:ABC-type antimicrobial peptide transport system permease subunit
MLGSAAIALWVAAGGCVVLALAAIGAVAGAQLRSRRGEVVVLRAIGFGSREQGAIRRRELAFVSIYGAITGLVAGVVVVLVSIAPLARAAVPTAMKSLPTDPLFAPLALPVAAAVLAALVAGALAVYGRQVVRQARDITAHEVER